MVSHILVSACMAAAHDMRHVKFSKDKLGLLALDSLVSPIINLYFQSPCISQQGRIPNGAQHVSDVVNWQN